MKVFYGKMKDEHQCDGHFCRASVDSYFGSIQPGDYAFIRLAKDGAYIKRLWKFKSIEKDSNGEYTAHFDDVFTFDLISVDLFTRLSFFKVGITLCNKVWKQSKGVGFFEIELSDSKQFLDSITSVDKFNQFLDNQNNCRIIEFVYGSKIISDKNIQIINKNGSYEIFNSKESFLSELLNKYNPNRYEEYIQFLKDNPGEKPTRIRKKVKDWLESRGTNGELTLENIWDFFCSKQPFKSGNNSKVEPEIEISNDVTVKNNCGNLIIYGIPGCGKSYMLKTSYLSSFSNDKIFRTTFHPDYSNTDFVGQVRPIKNGSSLDYKLIPGPFTQALYLAYKHPNNNVALVIEEINRGNAAAIFGDLFQLLDRDVDGNSEYEINNETIISYLAERGIFKNTIRIPSNMFLFATMNTSDQNVFKLDTAFKRRWEFLRLTNKDTASSVKDFSVFEIDGVLIKWKSFIEVINNTISSNDDISGDRQIGNFFYEGDDNDLKRFANKVLEYLYNDVCKYGGKEDIFNVTMYKNFDDIYDAFISGENVFSASLVRELISLQNINVDMATKDEH